MRVYLDNCCYNRLFDNQGQLRVRLETEAKLRVQDMMRSGELEYAWSSVLDYEIGRSPFLGRRSLIVPWRDGATVNVALDEDLIARGAEIMSLGVKKMDALHLACAESAACDWFFTLDRGILKKVQRLGEMRVANPIEFVLEELS
jgi:hypothetical protein